MKKLIIFIIFIVFTIVLIGQEIQHETIVVNIEVPVRVFDGGKFVENLTIDDFEVYEDGKLQNVVAVYLIKKKDITKKEEKRKIAPNTSRTFYLFFEIYQSIPRIEEALLYFVQNVLVHDDNLFIVTPMKTYEMYPEALKLKSTEEVVDELIGLLRKDAMISSSDYRSSISELTRLTRAFSAVFKYQDKDDERLHQEMASELGEREALDPLLLLESLVTNYTGVLNRLDNLRYIDQAKLLENAQYLKNKEGQKYIFLFYQREFIPQIDPLLLTRINSLFQVPHITHSLSDLFQLYRREITLDVERVKKAYADSSASIHFMFFTKPAEHTPGIRYVEHSEDIYAAFREMATATGGITESSSNPFYLFQNAVESAENYYLLYYSPLNYMKDGKFRNVNVKIKNKNYRVIHRAGYFAN